MGRDSLQTRHSRDGYHVQSITKYKVESNDGITVKDFDKLMTSLKEQGFEAINTQQLAASCITTRTFPGVPRFSYKMVAAMQITSTITSVPIGRIGLACRQRLDKFPGTSEALWQENIVLEEEGWVDHQAYGITMDIKLNDRSSDESLQKELKGSITAFEKSFDKKPIAFIWPLGSFGCVP